MTAPIKWAMTNPKPRRLGRGLTSLLEDTQPQEVATKNHELLDDKIVQIPIDDLAPNSFQPRIHFEDRHIEELAQSIRVAGLMQPIIVRQIEGGGYELIAGERRWRAAKMAGLTTIPAIIKQANDRRSAELALIENVQRADLNPIERANAYRTLMGRFQMTQADVADRVGLDRSSVANLLRLLELPEDVRAMIATGTISAGHGKMLASIADAQQQRRLVERILAEHLSVRQTERAVREIAKSKPAQDAQAQPSLSPDRHTNIRDLETRLGDHLKTRVRIELSPSGSKGRVVIDFYDLEHFDGLMHAIGFDTTT